jgi:MFS family permease
MAEGEGAPTKGKGAFIAFRYRNFRLMWSASLLSSSGTWLQNVAVPFVIYRITESGFWLGFAGFLSYLPMVLIGPWSGSLADRYPRRTILLITGTAQFLLTLVLAVTWAAGVHGIAAILVLLLLNSFAAGLGIASWQAFVTELVPREHLLNAVTLNSAQFNAARAFGPALGGIVLATLGPGWCFFLNALSFLAMVGALLMVRMPKVERPKVVGRSHPLTEMREALRYVRTEAGIVVCLLIVFALGFLGGPLFNLLVVFADDVYKVGDGAYGLLAACMGAGAILFAPLVAGRGSRIARSRLVAIAMVAYGLALIALGLAPVAIVGAAALFVAGAGYLGISSTLNTTVQLQVTEEMRGKVLALYVMTLTVAIPIGSLIQGWLVDLIGVQATVISAGTVFLGVFAVLRFATSRLSTMDDLSRGSLGTQDDAELRIAEAESAEAAVDPI